MLRIIILVTTYIVVNADSTLNSYSSNNGFKPFDYGSGNSEKYSKGSSKYYLSSGSSPGTINSGLSSSYPSSVYSDASQGESLTDQSASNYESTDSSYSPDGQASASLSSYSRDRPYALSSSDYSPSQSEYSGSSNPQSEFSGRTDYEGSALNDFTGSATQQYTVGTSYRGSSLESYPGSQEATNIRSYQTSSQGSSPSSSAFVGSPSYPDPSSNRGVYTGSGFKALDVSGFRGYHPGSGTRDFLGSGKHRGHVASVSSKYPIYESVSSDGYSGNEVEYTPSYSSPHAYSTGNYKRESYNSAGGAHGAYSNPGFNYLPGSVKASYQIAGIKGHTSAYPGGLRESGSSPVHFGGSAAHGSEGTRFIVSGSSPSFGAYSQNPSLSPKGHGSFLSGGSGGSGKIFIIKDSSSGSPHSSGSSFPGGHMFSNAPIIGGSFKTTRGASYGGQGASFSYTPSFAGGSSPSYTSRFPSGGHGGGSSYPSFMSAS